MVNPRALNPAAAVSVMGLASMSVQRFSLVFALQPAVFVSTEPAVSSSLVESALAGAAEEQPAITVAAHAPKTKTNAERFMATRWGTVLIKNSLSGRTGARRGMNGKTS